MHALKGEESILAPPLAGASVEVSGLRGALVNTCACFRAVSEGHLCQDGSTLCSEFKGVDRASDGGSRRSGPYS